MSTNPNPQGKGLVPVLQDVTSSRAGLHVPPKQIDQIAGELFTSMFVLESEFAFRPVAGKDYYLYRKQGRFRLSLISPDQWTNDFFGKFIGRCIMQKDITWTLELDDQAAQDPQLSTYIVEKKRDFEKVLESADCLEKIRSYWPTLKNAPGFAGREEPAPCAITPGSDDFSRCLSWPGCLNLNRRLEPG